MRAASTAEPGERSLRRVVAGREPAIHLNADCLEFVPAWRLNLFDYYHTRLLLLLGFDAGGADAGTRVGKTMDARPTIGVN